MTARIFPVAERRDDPEPPRVTRTLFVSDCSGGSTELSIDLDGFMVIRQADDLDGMPVALMTVLDPAAVAAMLRMVDEARGEIERRGRMVLLP